MGRQRFGHLAIGTGVALWSVALLISPLNVWIRDVVERGNPGLEFQLNRTLTAVGTALWFLGPIAVGCGLAALGYRKTAGLFVLACLILLAGSMPGLESPRYARNEAAAISNLRTINTAEVTYLSSSNGKYGAISDLIDKGIVDSTFVGERSGYTYKVSVTADGKDYSATALPSIPDRSGRYAYASNAAGIVRYATPREGACKHCFPPGLAGKPVD
jgi:hypothetical protein